LVPILDFFKTEIVPELEAPVDQHAILQASALNFVTNFRRSFGPQEFQLVFPCCIKFLSSNAEALRSLAAYTMERFLALPAFGRPLLQPHLAPALQALFALLTTEKRENPYVM